MNELKIFSYESNDVRIVQKDGEPWWVLKDVCDVLELSNPTMVADRLDEDEKTKVDPKSNLGSRSNEPVTVINESGLYNVILRSDKPEAKKFKRWVTHEVLPAIRRDGAYVAANEGDTDEMIMARAILAAKRTIDRQKEQIDGQKKQIDEMKPKALFADAVAASDGTILIGELAKILKGNGIEIGQNRLFKELRRDGFLIRRNGTDYNTPTQRAMEMGLFKVKETAITHADGHVTVSKTTKVTGKGQLYFINRLMKRRSRCNDATGTSQSNSVADF
jgi:anti-repressor protein